MREGEGGEREKERERDRETDRETDREKGEKKGTTTVIEFGFRFKAHFRQCAVWRRR